MLFYGYQVKSDHRDNSHRKSQWKICEIDELKIFTFGFCNNWCSRENDVLWSCSENFQAIGVESQENKNAGSPYDKLYFARFTKMHNIFGTDSLFPNIIKMMKCQKV